MPCRSSTCAWGDVFTKLVSLPGYIQYPWKEVDIALITDGLLVVAEVKQGKIGERDIEGFCELGKAIRPNRLIFFASKKPSKRISKKLEAAAQELKALAVELKFGIVEDI